MAARDLLMLENGTAKESSGQRTSESREERRRRRYELVHRSHSVTRKSTAHRPLFNLDELQRWMQKMISD